MLGMMNSGKVRAAGTDRGECRGIVGPEPPVGETELVGEARGERVGVGEQEVLVLGRVIGDETRKANTVGQAGGCTVN